MKLHVSTLEALKVAGIVLSSLGLFSALGAAGVGDTFVARAWGRYTNNLEKTMRLLFIEGSAQRIAYAQLAMLTAVVGARLAIGDIPYWYVVAALVVVGPVAYLSSERRKRVAALEMQLDGVILALANSLKTVPSPGAALQATVPILHNPMRQEIERVVKEMRVGNTLEQALGNMSSRIGSRAVDSALGALLIGLQVGGDLPFVLENTAATIREMNRLEGVVRTKTSEGRAQLWVLAVFPFGICAAFNAVQPGYFEPLQRTFVGYLIIGVATILWLASLLVARKVLKVDI